MKELLLRFTLESEACFSRGDGVAGLVDTEVSHDRYGMPFLGGRALKGLLHAEAAEILDGLRRAQVKTSDRWHQSAASLFGQPGSLSVDEGKLRVGNAQLPSDLRSAVIAETNGSHPHTLLETLTTIRRQTALDETGAPKAESLRSLRVILRKTPFEAKLEFAEEPSVHELAFLAACVKAFRRAGSNKTRGLGELSADLYLQGQSQAETNVYFKKFKEGV